jgi:hypothetical protein
MQAALVIILLLALMAGAAADAMSRLVPEAGSFSAPMQDV